MMSNDDTFENAENGGIQKIPVGHLTHFVPIDVYTYQIGVTQRN